MKGLIMPPSSIKFEYLFLNFQGTEKSIIKCETTLLNIISNKMYDDKL